MKDTAKTEEVRALDTIHIAENARGANTLQRTFGTERFNETYEDKVRIALLNWFEHNAHGLIRDNGGDTVNSPLAFVGRALLDLKQAIQAGDITHPLIADCIENSKARGRGAPPASFERQNYQIEIAASAVALENALDRPNARGPKRPRYVGDRAASLVSALCRRISQDAKAKFLDVSSKVVVDLAKAHAAELNEYADAIRDGQRNIEASILESLGHNLTAMATGGYADPASLKSAVAAVLRRDKDRKG